MRVLFVSPPFSGHLNRLVPLAVAARDAGHDCAFVTGHAKLGALRERGFQADAPPSLAPGAIEAIAEGYGRVGGRPWRGLAQMRAMVRLLPGLTDDLVDVARARRADVLVADSVAIMAGPAAERLAVPWLTTLATPLALETRTGTPSFLGGWSPPRGPTGHLRDALARAAIRGTKRTIYAFLHRSTPLVPPTPFRPDGSERIYSPHAMLGFGMTELEFARDWPPRFEMIGPLFGTLEAAPPIELPDAERRVLVTLGTHLPWARARWLRDTLRAASELPGWHFTVSHGRVARAHEAPERLAANVVGVPLVDYARDVARHDAVIHHGGSGIAYAAIAAGVPSLVMPQDYDQFDYAARIAHHGLGLRVRSLRGAASALERLVGEPRPALERFRAAATRYRPSERFLATLAALP